ncbi:DUF1460 domain-containing protein [Vibrio sp. Of7-15]|uniref:N-acetylmuramoyl-L-alanine amidase-like domain-containing protein n=1 Tax=Vibrio sp. Of7-15 TaxID=2724879 RepID=UPI001EF24B74|nr:N-acetylmuramoyl-L-alanine amidase-like domain-containing protein [Vibrio sp. Of7-15]MCG7499787.1 DUF1460 domain-containing protein [Vibrio sp. Of7-15]
MKYKLTCLLLFVVPMAFAKTNLTTGNINENKLIDIIKSDSSLKTGDRIKNISQLFLDTPYVANRLIGSEHDPEELVIDFTALDCFTYLDYVEALSQSDSMMAFTEKLIDVRYIDGQIDYSKRRHFFSDWVHTTDDTVEDITQTISDDAQSTVKQINRSKSGGKFIQSVPVSKRKINYIPSDRIDETMLSNLKTGDYIGIYTNIDGLDVTHTGIFLNTSEGPVLRHASSKKADMKVTDSPFLEYVKSTPGIMVFRSMA